jgi:hypothetical protein
MSMRRRIAPLGVLAIVVAGLGGQTLGATRAAADCSASPGVSCITSTLPTPAITGGPGQPSGPKTPAQSGGFGPTRAPAYDPATTGQCLVAQAGNCVVPWPTSPPTQCTVSMPATPAGKGGCVAPLDCSDGGVQTTPVPLGAPIPTSLPRPTDPPGLPADPPNPAWQPGNGLPTTGTTCTGGQGTNGQQIAVGTPADVDFVHVHGENQYPNSSGACCEYVDQWLSTPPDGGTGDATWTADWNWWWQNTLTFDSYWCSSMSSCQNCSNSTTDPYNECTHQATSWCDVPHSTGVYYGQNDPMYNCDVK